ncbi:MAG: hypothetical protein AYK19_01035 [Theionarchaea archaeon DG-70-1]|nr:MAG: hypothetical protein AYK19_01035 [Theionarchaea archaeon DG-70-1]
MPFDQCIAVLDKFFSFCNHWNRFPHIWLTGGEPIIHPRFWDILDYIDDHSKDSDTGFHVSVLSNGFKFDGALLKKLERYPVVHAVQISVDGARAESHDAIRGKGSFDRAIRALNLLVPSRLETHMHFVVFKDNYEDAFEMTDLAKKLGIDILTITRLVPWGRGGELRESMLNTDQVQILFKKLSDDYDVILQTDSRKPTIGRNRCDWPVIYPDPSTPDAFAKNGYRCGVAYSYINVMENGDVYPCRRMPIIVGNLLEEDLMHIWQHPLMWKLREKQRFVQGKCRNCFFLKEAPDICSGGASCIAYAVHGDPFQPDPQCPYNPPEGS